MNEIHQTIYSTYEINREDKLIRRLKGQNDPTPRQGTDGVWKSYYGVREMDALGGVGLIIEWDDQGHCTFTSPLVKMIAHDHIEYVEGCFRCDLSRAEVERGQH